MFGSQWWLDAFVLVEARGLDALEQAFATIIGDRAQALIVLSDGVLFKYLLTRADEVIEYTSAKNAMQTIRLAADNGSRASFRPPE